MERVGGHGRAQHLGLDRGTTLQGMLSALQDHDPGAFAVEEPVAVTVERSGGALRIVVAARERAHVAQRCEGHGKQRRLRPAGQHHIRLPVLDHAQPILEADHGAGTRSDLRDDRPEQPVLHGELAGGHRAGQGRDGERAYLARPAAREDTCPFGHLLLATAARVERDRDPIALLRRPVAEVEAAVGHRFLPRGHPEMDEAAHPAGHLAVHDGGWVEALDLGRDAHVEPGGVERGDRSGTADPGHKVAPEARVVVADGRDGADTGDDGAARQVLIRHGWSSSGCVDRFYRPSRTFSRLARSTRRSAERA